MLGIALPTRHLRDPAAVRDVVDLAERLDAEPGWSDLWIGDSLLALPLLESLTLMAALAARTSRVRLGVACQASLGLRDPLLLAAQWATIDQLSNGRATLIACPGWGSGEAVRRELRAFGIGYPEKTRRMERNIALLREASVAGTVTLDGSAYELPTPFVQQPLPIWFTANPAPDAAAETVERLLDRVARLGDGWLTYYAGAEQFAARLERLRSLRAAHGRVVDAPVCVGVNVNLHPDGAVARADARAAWARVGTRGVSADDLDGIGAIGSPEQVAARLRELLDAGATHLSIYLLSEDPIRQADLLSEHLLPLLTPTPC